MEGAGGRRDVGAVEPARMVVWAVAMAAVGAAAWLWLADGSRGAAEPAASAEPVAGVDAGGAPASDEAPAAEDSSTPEEGGVTPTATASAAATPTGIAAATPTASAPATTGPAASEPTPTVGGPVTALPSASPSAEPAPPGQTVLFRGGPATGPWQQIGSVAEITHPEADPRAATSYRDVWSDPEEENQPDWLWDQIVAEVAAEAVSIGVPLDRPFAGSAPDTEAFNAFGGVEEIDFEEQRFSAFWNAVLTQPDGHVARAYWFYLVDFNARVLGSSAPFLVSEGEIGGFEEATDLAQQELEFWVETFQMPSENGP